MTNSSKLSLMENSSSPMVFWNAEWRPRWRRVMNVTNSPPHISLRAEREVVTALPLSRNRPSHPVILCFKLEPFSDSYWDAEVSVQWKKGVLFSCLSSSNLPHPCNSIYKAVSGSRTRLNSCTRLKWSSPYWDRGYMATLWQPPISLEL